MAAIWSEVQNSANSNKLLDDYENRLEDKIMAYGQKTLGAVTIQDLTEWLKIYALVSDFALEGPADITLQLKSIDPVAFDSAKAALTPQELAAVDDLLDSTDDPPLTLAQLEAASISLIDPVITGLGTNSSNPILAKFIVDQENTQNRIIRYTGKLHVYNRLDALVGSYDATTGGFVASYKRKNGPTPPGYYRVSHYRSRKESWCNLHGVGFTFDIDEEKRTGTRGAFRIHPDGDRPGTHGCVGINESAQQLRQLVTQLQDNLKQGVFRLFVEYKS